ncbi:MAG: rhodanese-like domain-containing protein [Elusimicrobia bacterium]|nr:rhodanese-like domain-containing protein [Elusimicrobiota bacterium]
MKKLYLLTIALLFCLLIGNTFAYARQNAYVRISATQARNIMNGSEPYIILDVRTPREFRTRRIRNAILIPHTEIRNRALAELPDKNIIILIYCQGGVRSANAARAMIELGYTNVFDFGGIADWPYETISG